MGAEEDEVVKPEPAPECMQDGPKPQPEVLEEVNLRDEEGAPRPVFISAALERGMKERLVQLLQ